MVDRKEIIALLKKEQNQALVGFFLQKMDSMLERHLQDLHFLLTVKDKGKISEFLQKESQELQKQFSALVEIGKEAKKLTVQYQEKQERRQEDSHIENLLLNL